MIEPVGRCNKCLRTISSFELSEWAEERSRAWWSYNVNGWCSDCSETDYLLLKEELEEGGES